MLEPLQITAVMRGYDGHFSEHGTERERSFCSFATYWSLGDHVMSRYMLGG